MNRSLIVIVVGLLLAFALAVSSAAQEDTETIHHSTAAVHTHPLQGDVREIEGAEAELFATEDGITMSFRTNGLEEGHVYTAWVVMINTPEACAATPCEASDILGNTDAVQSEITYGDGIIVGEDGIGNFAAHVEAGDVPGGWHGIPFTNPLGSSVHIVINDHGSLIPGQVANMLNSYRGGCSDESLPPPFPDTAKADGEAGPNTCRLVQVAIFEPIQ
jgi:hypothetical protein